MFASEREISRSNGRTGDNLPKRESTVQNGRVGTYEYSFLLLSAKLQFSICTEKQFLGPNLTQNDPFATNMIIFGKSNNIFDLPIVHLHCIKHEESC